MHATTQSVRFVSERVMALAAALASKKVPLLNLFHLKSKIYVPEQKKKRCTMTALSAVRCFVSNGSACGAKINLRTGVWRGCITLVI